MKNSLKCPLSFWNDSSSFLAAKSGERLAAICGDAWRVRFYTPEQVGRICQYLEGYFIFLHGSCIKVTCFTLILLVFLALFKKDSIRRNEQKKKIYQVKPRGLQSRAGWYQFSAEWLHSGTRVESFQDSTEELENWKNCSLVRYWIW